MPNVPFAITDGSLTFLGTRAMGEMRKKKVEWKRLEERGQRERRRGLDKTREGRDQRTKSMFNYISAHICVTVQGKQSCWPIYNDCKEKESVCGAHSHYFRKFSEIM